MSASQSEDNDLRDMLLQLHLDPSSSNEPSQVPNTIYVNDADSEAARNSSWVELYRKYRRPISPSRWNWTSKPRPGKHCDAHLIDFFSCLDQTKDKLGPEDPPEKYCLASRELTAACMAHTLCEPKMFEMAEYCPDTEDPNKRSQDCWLKIYMAQNCVRQTQILLGKTFWASTPELMSSSERYMLLLGAPTSPGKRAVSSEYIQRRKKFLKSALATKKKLQEGDIPFFR